MAVNGRNFVVQQRRAECLMLVLQWRGATLADGEIERVELGAQDEKLSTGLHYCAASGLKRCVEVSNIPYYSRHTLYYYVLHS